MVNIARAIIKVNDDYIFMKREKYINGDKNIFYSTVGGHVEEYEDFEDACIREVFEELGINVEIDSLFHEEYIEELQRYEKFYIVKYISGKIGTGQGVEFTNIDEEKFGKYEITKINKRLLDKYNILPETVRIKLMENER